MIISRYICPQPGSSLEDSLLRGIGKPTKVNTWSNFVLNILSKPGLAHGLVKGDELD